MSPIARSEETHSQSAGYSWLVPVMVLGAQLPLVIEHFRNLCFDPQYQCFPLVLLAVFLLYRKRRSIQAQTDQFYLRGQVAFLSCGLLLFGLAIVLHSPWVATVAFVVSIGSVFLKAAHPGNLKGMMAAWALMWLLLPLPMGYGETLQQSLQSGSSQVASRILDLFAINHLLYGNVLLANGERYFVDEACSGMKSLVAMLSIVAIYLVSIRRALLPSIMLLAIAVAASFAMNAIRITSVIVLDPVIPFDLSTGIGHELLGVAVFALTLVMLFSADGLCMVATAPIFVPQVFERLEDRNWMVGTWNRLFGVGNRRTAPVRINQRSGWNVGLPVLSILFCLTSFIGGLSGFQSYSGLADVNQHSVATASKIGRGDLDITEISPGLQLAGFRSEARSKLSRDGQFSRIWRLNSPLGPMTVSLDFPFVKFHDLSVCYEKQGWRIVSDTRHQSNPETATPEPAFHEVRMERAPGEFGYLYYSLFNASSNDGGDGLSSRLKVRSKLSKEPFLQAQCFVESANDLTTTERNELINRFLKCRTQLSQRVYGEQL